MAVNSSFDKETLLFGWGKTHKEKKHSYQKKITLIFLSVTCIIWTGYVFWTLIWINAQEDLMQPVSMDKF